MPIGLYPPKALSFPNSAFVIDDDLIFSAVRFEEVKIEEYYFEREWLKPEEVRLLSALVLAVPVDYGKVFAYPHPLSFRIDEEEYDLSNTNIIKQIKTDFGIRGTPY